MSKVQTTAVETLDFEIENLDAGGFDPNRVRIMVYGESGVGKTRFAATWPSPFFVDMDDGLASVDTPVARVPVSVDTYADRIWSIYDYLATGEHPYKTIILDSLNEAQAFGLKSTVAAFPSVRRPYDSLAGQSDYGKMLADFDDVLRYYKSLPYHLILIAQVQSREFDTDLVQPQLIGKSTARNVARMVDVVGYMYRDGDANLNMSFKASDYVTKDRSGKLPATMQNPSYKAMASFWSPTKQATK